MLPLLSALDNENGLEEIVDTYGTPSGQWYKETP
jgi:hypothetical protein